ncbi:hypothetical protein SAMN05444161_1723 [Rhizobiales bacterium GAS191]|jgi:hypothetical protein|nr:hypothetical protein SAMN05519103_00833 [Rhizobiales bacterium GAS113]SEC54872.1 hypothetical protein SAMN05519104_1591 [Rhizobiales bacterium GAS188]SEC73149.1 hypothetical protein SAMN05444161_1723 [Rhizobiales bacterium GAS191]
MTGTQDVSGRRSAASSDGARDAAEAAAPPPDARSMLAALREVVRRAWQTLATLRDPDLHYFRRGGWLFSVVHDVNQAYGYASAQARGFRPSSQDVSRMEVVMHWMAWLRRTEGELALKRIIGWSMGVPSWQMARREGCSERTIANRIDRSLNAVLKAFGDLDAEPPLIEEAPPQPDRLRAHRSERPTAMQAGTLQPGKLWIDGIGWMFEGRRWNDGSSLAEAAEASHRRRGG